MKKLIVIFFKRQESRNMGCRFLQTCPTPLSNLVQFYLIPLKLDIIYVRSLRVFLAFTRPILAKTEIIYPKNVGASVAMIFT